jgi:hypothetical protein
MSASWVAQTPRRSVVVFVAVATFGLSLSGGVAAGSAASPTATGPVTGGKGVPAPPNLNGFDLSQVGYQQSEFFLSGTASAYGPSPGPLTTDGKWTVAPIATATYKTRTVVYRPIDPTRFNGTVIVEWLNVSGGIDADPDWTLTHNELVRDGFAWVGVSAQALGLNATKAADPVRYASLSHPGDSFSYDIFSQAGQAIRDHSTLMLGGLTPNKIIAAGESQSASRLVTYIDAVAPVVHVYDGFLVHSRGATGAPLSQVPQAVVATPNPTMIRNDLDVPVFVFETETDVFNSNTTDRQPDTNLFRLWEVAGSSHFDYYGLAIGPTDTGNGQGAVLNLAAMQKPTTDPAPGFSCNLPINTAGTHWVLNAAVFWLNQWVVHRDEVAREGGEHEGEGGQEAGGEHGIAPPTAPYLQVASTSPVVFAHDADGNVLGGVRSPQVDAPIAALGGVGNTGSTGLSAAFCRLFGTTIAFTPTQLAAHYENHRQFVSRWNQAARRAVKGGYLLEADANELKASAATSTIGK